MKKIITILLIGLLIWNVILTTQLSSSQNRIDQLESQSKVSTKAPINPNNRVNIIEHDTENIQDVVNHVSPAVVTILAERQNMQVSSGSGVVYSKDNSEIWLVTNNHVIERADNYRILFQNQETVEAELVGADVLSDLAILKAEINFDIDPLPFGDSSALEIGQTVLAFGSPGGENFAGTVTKGIISGTNRSISVDLDGDFRNDWDMVLIQTDAAINPGNSGGALVNLNSELIGINTIKIADQAYEGMGFAIPSNEVVNIISQLEADGEVKRPSLGVSVFSLNEVNEVTRQMLDILHDSGLYVNEVIANSPADLGGVQKGDIITKVNGELITSFSQFRRILYSQEEGDQMNLEIIRNGETVGLIVTL